MLWLWLVSRLLRSLGGRSSAGMSAAAVSAKATQKVVANPRLDLTILDG
jgi:hypothetical protein